jgi:hypothetical protein
MMYSTERVNPKEGRKLLMPVYDTPDTLPDTVFTSPAAP